MRQSLKPCGLVKENVCLRSHDCVRDLCSRMEVWAAFIWSVQQLKHILCSVVVVSSLQVRTVILQTCAAVTSTKYSEWYSLSVHTKPCFRQSNHLFYTETGVVQQRTLQGCDSTHKPCMWEQLIVD